MKHHNHLDVNKKSCTFGGFFDLIMKD